MKKFLLLLCLSAFFGSQAQDKPGKPFTISGDLSKIRVKADWVQLYYIMSGKGILDSSKVKDGKYSFKGLLEEPTISRIRAIYKEGAVSPQNAQRSIAYVFLQPGKMTISSTDSFSNIKVGGSSSHIDFMKLDQMAKLYSGQIQALVSQYSQYRSSGDMVNLRKTEMSLDSLSKEMNEKVYARFIKSNPRSAVALFALQQYAGSEEFDISKIEPLYDQLAPALQNTSSGKSIKERIDIYKRTSIGEEALDFTQPDTLGNPLKLSAFRGKYLLLDFWASWCGPCRQENPNVVKAFQRFKDKGFYILGVSLDRPDGREKWLQAIHDDRLTWAHVSDLQFWNNEVARLYGIQAIPQNLLLDPTGKIIGKNLRGEELEKKLSEVLGN
jgi:peroxiredoxin